MIAQELQENFIARFRSSRSTATPTGLDGSLSLQQRTRRLCGKCSGKRGKYCEAEESRRICTADANMAQRLVT
jgi:hypothetical protein